MPCDDDEDLCDFGSGHGDGEDSVFNPNRSDSKLSDTCRLFSNFLCYLLKYNHNSYLLSLLGQYVATNVKLSLFARICLRDSLKLVQNLQLLQTG